MNHILAQKETEVGRGSRATEIDRGVRDGNMCILGGVIVVMAFDAALSTTGEFSAALDEGR